MKVQTIEENAVVMGHAVKAKHSENAPSGIVAMETSKCSHRNLDAIVHYTLSHI